MKHVFALEPVGVFSIARHLRILRWLYGWEDL